MSNLITAIDYFKIPALSGSKLQVLDRSPEHYRWEMDNPKEPTDPMIQGLVIHSLILENCLDGYLILPEKLKRDERTEAYRDYLLEAGRARKTIVTKKMVDTAKAMREACMRNLQTRQILEMNAETEFSMTWEERGVPCKGRPDRYIPEFNTILDLKSCANASQREFFFKVLKMGYKLQLRHYQAGKQIITKAEKAPGIMCLAVEYDPPYTSQAYKIPQRFIDSAETKRNMLLDTYKFCNDTGHWPSYSNTILDLGEFEYEEI